MPFFSGLAVVVAVLVGFFLLAPVTVPEWVPLVVLAAAAVALWRLVRKDAAARFAGGMGVGCAIYAVFLLWVYRNVGT